MNTNNLSQKDVHFYEGLEKVSFAKGVSNEYSLSCGEVLCPLHAIVLIGGSETYNGFKIGGF